MKDTIFFFNAVNDRPVCDLYICFHTRTKHVLENHFKNAAPSLNTFKSGLNKHWRNHPYKFKATCYITNQEIEGEHPSRSVYRSHEDLDDVEVQ